MCVYVYLFINIPAFILPIILKNKQHVCDKKQ